MFEDLAEDMEVIAKIQMQVMESQMHQVMARRIKMSETKTPTMSCNMLVIILVKLLQKPVEKEARNMVGKSEERGAKFLRVPPLPMGMDEANEVGNTAAVTLDLRIPATPSRPGEMVDDSRTNEPKAKIPRAESPEGSPTRLYAPHYAGNVNKVTGDIHPANEEQRETELEEYMNYEPEMDWTMVGLDAIDEGQPPQVDPETRREIEAAAGQEEISRLREMGMIRDPTTLELEQVRS